MNQCFLLKILLIIGILIDMNSEQTDLKNRFLTGMFVFLFF
ncbi:hypothetical protein LEP1GSC083_0072 [Leptospira interrogans serovar Pyrogenes str. L0374]|nr:hypothetical protein LEP1GSC083_0072 [Leptospira interrogans serovar Pyrogenes str. L0374]